LKLATSRLAALLAAPALLAAHGLLVGACAQAPAAPVRNAVVFIADGLRHDAVTAADAPTLTALRREGVEFANSHAVLPTLTTPNAAAIATGHAPGDTGDFGNALYVGFRVFEHGAFEQIPGTSVPFIENDAILGDIDARFPGGNFLGEASLLSVARANGFNTAAIGKLGPVAIQDVSQVAEVDGGFPVPATVILDDATGKLDGVPIPPAIQAALRSADLALAPPPRLQFEGDVETPGTHEANRPQQRWFADAATRAVLPAFAASGRPFVLVFWSRDPDGSQHNQGDSLNALEPGINGPTSRAGIANADANLRQILDYLRANPRLAASTDVFVTSDHGFATISKHQLTPEGRASHSYAASQEYRRPDGHYEVKKGWLPPGFLAIDVAHALGEPVFDPDTVVRADGQQHYLRVDPTQVGNASSRPFPVLGNALIGGSGAVQARTDARVIIAANGGSDLVYVPGKDRALVTRLVAILAEQDYTGGIFVDSSFGQIPGALPLSAIGYEGTAAMPRPQILVGFKSFLRKPGDLLSAALISDTPLQEGQGMHGSFARDNTFNNMEAWGPDFRVGFRDTLPAGNLDIAPTLAYVLGLRLPAVGRLQGRVLVEALTSAPPAAAAARSGMQVSESAAGRATWLTYQELSGVRYLDEAGFR
jgi:arylsulfatase A-like enzyme